MKRFERRVTVRIPGGVHARIAARLTQLAAEHGVKVHIFHQDEYIDCTSVLEILSRGVTSGSRITVRAEGENSRQALAAIENLLAGDDEA